MKHSELVKETVKFVEFFFEDEPYHIVDVIPAERTVTFYANGFLHYVTYRRDGMTEWGTA